MLQLSGGKPLSRDILAGNAPTTFSFALCNIAQVMPRLAAPHASPLPMDIEYVGIVDYVYESIQDLLARKLDNISDSYSSKGRHHPSLECFKANTPDGHVVDGDDGEATSPITPGDEDERGANTPPLPLREQLWARQKDPDEELLQLEHKRAELECELGRKGYGRCAHADGRVVNQHIWEDRGGLLCFNRPSQNIIATATVLEVMLESAMSEEHSDREKLRTLLQCAAEQQAESSASR